MEMKPPTSPQKTSTKVNTSEFNSLLRNMTTCEMTSFQLITVHRGVPAGRCRIRSLITFPAYMVVEIMVLSGCLNASALQYMSGLENGHNLNNLPFMV